MPSTTARAGTRLTYEDFLLFPDDGQRHELIDGIHYVTPSPNLRHQELVGRLFMAIATFLAARPGVGRVFLSPLDVVLSRFDVVEPDLLFVAGDQSDILTGQNVQGPPALVIEVLSKSTRKRDAHSKRELFERTGVREYWLVDSRAESVRVFRPSTAGHLAKANEVSAAEDGLLTTPLLPGCEIKIRELFRDLVGRD